MSIERGQGKYSEADTEVRKLVGEQSSIVLIVINGNQGNGFTVSSPSQTFPSVIPALLRHLATDIERQNTNIQN